MLFQSELFVCQSGEEKCEPRHAFGPAQRDHYLITLSPPGKEPFTAAKSAGLCVRDRAF